MQNLLKPLLLLAAFLLLSPQDRDVEVEHGLEWQLGEWQGTRRDPHHEGGGSESAMKMRVETILDGAGQTRAMEIVHDGGVYRGFAVQVYDPETKLWRREYVNDVRRTFASLEGQVEGERSVWRSVTVGRSRESRLVSERPEPDRWVRTMAVSEDDGETWRELWIDDLTRKK